MPLGMEVGLYPDDFVLDGDPLPFPKGGRAPNFWPMFIVAKRLDGCHKFSAHVCCDQTAGWMKLELGMVVGLSPGEFVSDGDPALLP